jgi:rhamnose utilization protein RhaD (predicted bifunctional aldolase and dehydrogenase)
MTAALLQTITDLSHEFGIPDYVKGGGGNTSCKTSDSLWVKPSGTTLAGLTPQSFVAMDRAALGKLYDIVVPADATAREALVKDMMAAAVKPGQTGRPSVEAPLHDILAGAFVVHTHPTLVNGMTCAQRGAETCARLFPEALWIPYVDPGFTLCMDVRNRVREYTQKRGKPPVLLVLENHGIFVTGNTADEVRAVYRQVMDALRAEYAKAGIATTLVTGPADEATAQKLRQLLGNEAVGVAGARFEAAPGPISPDHIVYAKSFPYDGPLTAEGIAAFRAKHGYTPLIYITPTGVYAIGTTQKKAELALELAIDGALVRQLAGAFGGIRYLDDRSRAFIENWEVESYRQKQMT